MEKRPELAGRRLWKRERSTPEGGYGKAAKKGRARQEPVEMELAQHKGAFYAL